MVNNENSNLLTGVSGSGSGTNAITYTVVAAESGTNYNLISTNGSLSIGKVKLMVSGLSGD